MKKINGKFGFSAITVGAFALALGLVACGDGGSSNGPSNDDDSSSSSDVIPEDVSSSSVILSDSEGSSSSVASSSSAKNSSSVKAAWAYLNPDIDYGEFTDERDGQVYKTVKIGTQTWMAENLNYAYKGVKFNYDGYTSDSTSWCYENKASNCDKYGRLYTWSAVMDSAAQFSVNAGTKCGYGKTCTPNSPHRGICPEGWHVPNDAEWNTLWTVVGGTRIAAAKLKSTSGWYHKGNGTDSFGFTVLPAGLRGIDDGDFMREEDIADFWSSGEYKSYSAYSWTFHCDYGDVARIRVEKYEGYSVRCLRDSDEGVGASSSSSQAKPTNSSSSVKYGSLNDSRDGRTYKTVSIGTQTWMAENLNYNTNKSYCYESETRNCSKYGRLYEWSAAMDACPTGWHLPSYTEWDTLWTAVGGISSAGRSLKSTSGWFSGGNGTDSFDFAVLPAGYRGDDEHSYDEGESTIFWSSTELYRNYAYGWFFNYNIDDVPDAWLDKLNSGAYVRCLRDSSEGSETSSSSSVEYGSLTDSRDGQNYKTITIGTQTWMAENLNYNPGDVSSMGSYAWSGCYGDGGYDYSSNKNLTAEEIAANCTTYGRLYTWEVAMDEAACTYGKTCGVSLNPTTPVRGVCPQGWHLPSYREFETLINYIDPSFGYGHTSNVSSSTAGEFLKSKSGWKFGGNGTDTYGFSALPGGGREIAGEFDYIGYDANFWSSGEDYSNNAFFLDLDSAEESAILNYSNKNFAKSVRCLQD